MASAIDPLSAFKAVIATPEPPVLGPQRRPGTAGEAELRRQIEAFIVELGIPARIQPALCSAALLWHDHLDASHTISQSIETREGSWLHGIMHRREPDYGNAKYWFHRVGSHDAFPKLARRVTPVVQNGPGEVSGRLIKEGGWMPFAFIEECERSEQGRDPAVKTLLRQVQSVEFDVLVEHILASA